MRFSNQIQGHSHADPEECNHSSGHSHRHPESSTSKSSSISANDSDSLIGR